MSDDSRELLNNGEAVAHLQNMMQFGIEGLIELPNSIMRLIKSGTWQKRIVPTVGRVVEYAPDEFIRFVSDPVPDGLGASVSFLRDICRSRPDALDAIDQALGNGAKPGQRTDLVYNIHEVAPNRPAGTSVASALRRLRNHRPDLHQNVLDGTMSANAAMIEAGFRQHKISVPVDDVEAAARTLKKHFSEEQLAILHELLQSE